ncbi:hypothetical protein A8W25_02370 [Streptomyces sp. ERV7]|uniref:hypothetical protein n=1 Tax=Streptomyces sp. ERV7 TaxID=1322334 RepID=UPI0007F33900|nr:hypothetical protein [Streptomyces sp. ERV7]OAR27136.1 hypothetical protein A8W25_02370 [Streptomyces sp. ERV7]
MSAASTTSCLARASAVLRSVRVGVRVSTVAWWQKAPESPGQSKVSLVCMVGRPPILDSGFSQPGRTGRVMPLSWSTRRFGSSLGEGGGAGAVLRTGEAVVAAPPLDVAAAAGSPSSSPFRTTTPATSAVTSTAAATTAVITGPRPRGRGCAATGPTGTVGDATGPSGTVGGGTAC